MLYLPHSQENVHWNLQKTLRKLARIHPWMIHLSYGMNGPLLATQLCNVITLCKYILNSFLRSRLSCLGACLHTCTVRCKEYNPRAIRTLSSSGSPLCTSNAASAPRNAGDKPKPAGLGLAMKAQNSWQRT